MPFSFWPEVYMRKQPHIYELRSYHLKPGTMVEWGNYWARAIRMRDKKDHPTAFMGTFSQVGFERSNISNMVGSEVLAHNVDFEVKRCVLLERLGSSTT